VPVKNERCPQRKRGASEEETNGRKDSTWEVVEKTRKKTECKRGERKLKENKRQ